MTADNLSQFFRCIEIKQTEVTEITCKLGLWEVSDSNFERAFSEALHYFNQYHEDGEYKEILSCNWPDCGGWPCDKNKIAIQVLEELKDYVDDKHTIAVIDYLINKKIK